MRLYALSIPTPFSVGPVNVFLIAEDPITLVDTGPKTDEAFRALRDQVEARGVRLEQIRRIIISHAHEDHAGQAARLKEISGATVYVHPWDALRLRQGVDDRRARFLLRRVGVPPDIVEAFQVQRRRYRALLDPVPDVHLLDEGDELPFAGRSFKILHTPGHTPGHICLWRPGDRTLLAGDTILKRITPNPIMSLDPRDDRRRFPSLRMYLQSLARLRDLAPTVIYTGHGQEVDDAGAYYTSMQRHVRRRQSRLLELLPPHAVTAWEMSLKLFPEVREEQRFLALSETSAHIDFACEQGRLQREEREGVEYYRLT